MSHLLRPLVDEQQNQVDVLVVLGDGLTEMLEQRGLAGLGRRDDQTALAFADRRNEINYPGEDVVRLAFDLETEAVVRE